MQSAGARDVDRVTTRSTREADPCSGVDRGKTPLQRTATGKMCVSRRRLLGGVAGAGLGTVAGCLGMEDEGEGETTFIMAARWQNNSIDPMAGHTQLHRLGVFEPLLSVDYDGTIAPGLAESWDVSEDGETWTFELRDDVEFHDGNQFDASAMADSLRRAFGESEAAKTAGTALTELPVESVDVVDDYRLTITTDGPFAPLEGHLVRRFAVAMSPDSFDEDGEVTDAVGTGPFQFEDWDGGEGTTELSAFDGYYGDPPLVDRVHYEYVEDAQTRELMVRNTEIDMAIQLPPESIDRIEGADGVSVVTYQPPRLRFFTFNVTVEPVDDVRVRQAFVHGIDAEGIIDSVLEGVEEPATGPFPPSIDQWRNDALEPYEYDPDRAGELLSEAGWELDDGTRYRDGAPLELTLWTYTSRSEQVPIVEAIQSQLGDVGFDVEVRATEYGAMDDARMEGEAHVTFENWSIYGWPPDPDRLTLFYQSDSDMAVGYANDRVDEILETGRRTVDQAERRELYDELQEIVLDELPLGYFSYPESIIGILDDVDGFQPHPTEYKWGLERVTK